MILLTVSKLAKYFGADEIFKDVSFQINHGEKVALLGVNGAGKTTLLKIIAGELQPDEGAIHLDRATRIGYLTQEQHFDGQLTLWEEMEAALIHVRNLETEIRRLEQQLQHSDALDRESLLERYGELTALFEHAGGYHLENTIERTLQGLGFAEAQYNEPVSTFSGGQKTRAALASVLLSNPDLLLLDEPTNHLDLKAMEWLDDFLQTWPGTLIVISHDRHFLNQVTGRTLEMVFGGVEDYRCSYDRYLIMKAERLERRMKEFAAQQEFIARTEEFIRRYKAGQRSREAKGREKRLNRLKEQHLIARPRDHAKLKLSLDSRLRSGDLSLTLDRLGVGYESRIEAEKPLVLFQSGRLELERGERIAVIGPNGSGKTSLLRTLVGEIAPLLGDFQLGHNVDVGYYAQDHESLDLDASVLENVLNVDPELGEAQARTLLGRFLFSGDDVFKLAGDLSGGERSRVALAQLMLQQSNLLILDEPTNHLDLDAREALESVLKQYSGSILFVSHDRYLIDSLVDKLWVIDGGNLVEFAGNYSDYTAMLKKQQQAINLKPTRPEAPRQDKANRNISRQADTSRNDKQLKKRLAQLEAEIDGLEKELVQVKADLESASLSQDISKVSALGNRYVELEGRHHNCYEEWLRLAAD